MKPLDLRSQKLVICLGPGGVGKTTISAALAVRGTLLGCAVDVMTVDPAPRLLDALGLAADSSEPVEVALGGLRHSHRGGASNRARLRALRLDPKRTFDSIVARYASSAAARDTILENRIYRNLSGALAGVGDYMAMEKLLELAANPATDLIVLDTPPATEAIDFLDAPRRLLELLNSRAVTLLGAPSGFFRSQLRMMDIAARAVLAAFDRVTGLNLLSDVQSFVRSFDGMYEGFSARAERAQEKLRAPDTAIVIVTTAESSRIAQAREFVGALEDARLADRRDGRESGACEAARRGGTNVGTHRAFAQEKVEAQSRRLHRAQEARGSIAERAARFASGRRCPDGCARPWPRAAHYRGPRRNRPQCCVILTKRATRAAGRISDSFASAKPVPVFAIAQRSSTSSRAESPASPVRCDRANDRA